MCFNNVGSILNRSYVKKTNDINTVNRVKLDTDSEFGVLNLSNGFIVSPNPAILVQYEMNRYVPSHYYS